MDVYLVSKVLPSHSDAFLASIASLTRTALGEIYSAEVVDAVSTRHCVTVVTLMRNRHNPVPSTYWQTPDMGFVFSGYTVDEIDHKSVQRYFPPSRDDRRPVLRSPGGIYSYATIRRSDGQVFAGCSVPTMEPIYYSRGEGTLHLGNHPFLVHLASEGADEPRMDERFFFSALGSRVALDGSTPFVGCYRLPAHTGLLNVADSAAVQIVDVPTPTYGHHKLTNLRQRTAAMAKELTRATTVLQRMPVSEFRLSGGKDSRIIAAVLDSIGQEVLPLNNNRPEEGEGQVADRVARELGYESCVRRPVGEILRRETIAEETQRKIAYLGGLPNSATLQYSVRSEGVKPGVPIVYGHAHMQRGGLNGVVHNDREAMALTAGRIVDPFIRPEYSQPNFRLARDLVDRLVDGRSAIQRVSYYGYLEFGANYQLQATFSYLRNWHTFVTPMCDERFVALCTDIADAPAQKGQDAGITDLFYDRLAMGLLEVLHPRLLDIPLYAARFRADLPDRTGHQSRDPKSIVERPIPPADLQHAFNTRVLSSDLRVELWEHIEGTVVADLVRATAVPEIAVYVTEPSSPAPAGASAVMLSQFVWSMYGMSVILSTPWWRRLAGGQADS